MPISASQGTAPQKRSAPRKSAASHAAPAITQTEARTAGLLGLGQIAGAVCVMRGLYADAGAIGMHWPNVARETASLAAQNETIGKAIDYLNSAGPYAGILTAAMPLALQLLANHDRIDASKIAGMGVMSPETLGLRIESEIALKEAQAQAEADQAKQALADAMTDHAKTADRGEAA
jgi:hypothetical protein